MEKIGEVWVDTGLIWVGDPCYVLGDYTSSRVKHWSDFCNLLFNNEDYEDNNYSTPLGEGIGMAVQTLYGDGLYPVYAEYNENGFGGNGISRIIIDFDPQMDDDEFLYEEG